MKAISKSDLYRRLPSIDELLKEPEVAALTERHGRALVLSISRELLSRLRAKIASGVIDCDVLKVAISDIPLSLKAELHKILGHSLRPVINATGVILHTNLGRAPLADSAVKHLRETATRYSNLEFDLTKGERGKRDVHAQQLLAQIFADAYSEAVSTIVANNNAAAVLLALNSLAEGGEVIVSRGELVEIGGSFRIPDVMSKSGAVLREVGSTNRTRIADYERAINDRTRLLLRVHRSNFEIVGFTEQPTLQQLVELGRKHNIPVMEDLGSGSLIDLNAIGVSGEPNVFDSLSAGIDVVTYSGDKLLGGPQAGLLTGRPDLIARIRQNPLFRALRVDKVIYSILESTLQAYLRHDYDAIPVLRMMRLKPEDIRARAEAVLEQLRTTTSLRCEIIESQSVIGGGAAPGSTLPTFALAITHASRTCDDLASELRASTTPIIVRVENDRVLIDLRTVFPEQDKAIVDALLACA